MFCLFLECHLVKLGALKFREQIGDTQRSAPSLVRLSSNPCEKHRLSQFVEWTDRHVYV